MRKKGLVSLVLTVVMVAAMLVICPVANAANTDAVTKKMDEYVKFLDSYGNAYWNAGLRSSSSTEDFKTHIKNGDLAYGLTKSACSLKTSDGEHIHANGCTSNIFGGAAQCFGFAKYFSYYLYGSYPSAASGNGVTSAYKIDTKWTYFSKNIGQSTCPELKPGDFIRYYGDKTHAAVVYSVDSKGIITVIQGNGGDIGKCGVTKAALKLTYSDFQKYYENGKAYVCRYNGPVTETGGGTTEPPQSTTYVGYISGTNGALAIRSGASSSTTQIGRIPEGESCTVYPGKSYGMWYWVEYGNVKGFAYGKYITKTAPQNTPTAPAAPSIKLDKARIQEGETALLSWSSVANATSYVVTYVTEGDGYSVINTDTVTTNQITIKGLGAGTHQIYVVAKGSGGTSDESNTLTLTITRTLEPPVPPVISISTTMITEGETAILYWADVPNSAEYSLQIEDVSSAWGGAMINPFAKSPYTISDLAVGVYQITVTALGNGGSSGPSNVITLTVKSKAPSASVNVKTAGATNITSTSAQLNGTLSASGNVKITEHGAYLGTSTSSMTRVAKDTVSYNKSSLTMYYSTSKYGTLLKPGTTYCYYQYAVVDGKTVTGDIVYFTTPSASSQKGTIGGTNGALSIRQGPGTNYDQIGRITEGSTCTVYPGLASGSWYLVEYDGVVGYASKNYIKLESSSSTTRIGTVGGSNGALAIRNGAGTSYTQIGRIPEGATCTVYTDKTSGNWYYVEYNGVKGYAYKTYIKLN